MTQAEDGKKSRGKKIIGGLWQQNFLVTNNQNAMHIFPTENFGAQPNSIKVA